MPTAILLIVVGALARIVPHPPNAVPLGAIALFAGAKLPVRWAWGVPVAAMAVSDLILSHGSWTYLLGVGPVVGYGTFALIAVLGRWTCRRADPMTCAGIAPGGTILFFLTTNFAVWATGGGLNFPRTLGGLASCYAVALPFLQNQAMADLAGAVVLFGLSFLWELATARRWSDASA